MPRFLKVATHLFRSVRGTNLARSALAVLPQLSRSKSSRIRHPRIPRVLGDLLPMNRAVGVTPARLRAKRISRTLPNRVHNAVVQAISLRALDEACGLMQSALQDSDFYPNATSKRLVNSLLHKLIEAEKLTGAIALFLDAWRRKVITDSSWFFTLLKASIDACAMDCILMVTNHALRTLGVNDTEVLNLAAGPLIVGGHVQSIEQALWRVENEALAMSVLNSIAIRLACLFGKRDAEDTTLISIRNLYEWKFGPASGSNLRLLSYLDALIGEDMLRWSQLSQTRHPLAIDGRFASDYSTTGAASMPDEVLKHVLQHHTAKARFPWLPADRRATAIPDITDQLVTANPDLMFHQDMTAFFWGARVGDEPAHSEDDDVAGSKSGVVFVDIDMGPQNSAKMTVAIQFEETRHKDSFNRLGHDAGDEFEDDDDDEEDDDDEDEDEDEDDEDDDGDDDDDDISAADMIRFLAGTRDAQFLRYDLPSDLTGSMEGVVHCNDISEHFWSKRSRVRIGFEEALFDDVGDN